VDGWSGAGKSTFARGLAARLDAPCISTDDLVVGWDGLAGSIGLLVTCILAPLSVGEPARWNRFDWERLAPGPDVTCLSAPIVVVEGCAIGTAWPRSYLSYLIWIDTPAPERRRRLENRRDWPAYEPHVDHWADQERALRKGVGTIDHADLVVHGALADSFLAELEEGRSDAG